MMVATLDCQGPKPNGLKMGAIAPPMAARMLASISSTIRNAPSTTPKLFRNHMRMLDARIMVPAFLMKDQPRSHMLRSTFIAPGAW